jgi:hypothetical protein
MVTAVRRLLGVATAASALAVLSCGLSEAVEFKDIAGTWCTEVGRIHFDKTKMVIALSDGRRAEHQITAYEFGPANVVVKWVLENQPRQTTYGEFTGAAMVQFAGTDSGGKALPRREFHRC